MPNSRAESGTGSISPAVTPLASASISIASATATLAPFGHARVSFRPTRTGTMERI